MHGIRLDVSCAKEHACWKVTAKVGKYPFVLFFCRSGYHGYSVLFHFSEKKIKNNEGLGKRFDIIMFSP